MLLLTVYVLAAGANSLGVLSCDCAAHHSHDLCCNHHDHDKEHDCDHDHLFCAAFCDTDSCSQSIATHCSCTHRHGEGAAFTLSSDTDELLKYIKLFAGDAVCIFAVSGDSERVVRASVFRCRDDVPIAARPVISVGAPRAPSVIA